MHTSDTQTGLGDAVGIFAHFGCQNDSQTDAQTCISDVKIHNSDWQTYIGDEQTYISLAKMHTSDIQTSLGSVIFIFAHFGCITILRLMYKRKLAM